MNAADQKYACINRPATDEFPPVAAQDGWEDGKPRMVLVWTHWEKIACGYSERASDEGCGNCRWRNK